MNWPFSYPMKVPLSTVPLFKYRVSATAALANSVNRIVVAITLPITLQLIGKLERCRAKYNSIQFSVSSFQFSADMLLIDFRKPMTDKLKTVYEQISARQTHS